MSQGRQSRPKNVGWCGPEPLFLAATTRPAFFAPILHGGCLDGRGQHAPLKENGGNAATTQTKPAARLSLSAIAKRKNAPGERE